MPEERENKLFEGRFLKVATLVVLLALLGISGLLAYQNWRLFQELTAFDEQAAMPAPAAKVAASAPEPAPPPAKKPAAAVVAPGPSAATKPTGHYTQAQKELSPAVVPVADLEPPPVARVVPTDVIPAEPLPFPRTETPAPALPEKLTATLPAGTVLTVRLLDTLNTDRNQAGDRFRASLEEPITSDGHEVVPRGATVEGRIVDAQRAGRVKGVAEMTIELSQLRLAGGETVVLYSNSIRRQGETSMDEDVAKVGAGAAIGAVIGAIGGGGKGAAVGAASGAGAGTAGVLLTRGEPLILSQETVLSFQLNSPVTFTYTPGQSDEPVPATYDAPVQRAPRTDDWDRERPILRRRP
jgi:hypothetical protein